MSLMAFVLQCGPLLALTALTAALGFRLGGQIPFGGWPLFTISALALLIMLQIFKTVPRWNLVLLLGLALLAGALLNWLDIQGPYWLPWATLSLGMLLSLAWAYGLGVRLGWIGAAFSLVTIGYLLGWFLLYILPIPAVPSTVWAWLGLFIFWALGVHTVTEARFSQSSRQAIPLASDLFVVYFNLFWLGAAASLGLSK
jgi:hypothetical protein